MRLTAEHNNPELENSRFESSCAIYSDLAANDIMLARYHTVQSRRWRNISSLWTAALALVLLLLVFDGGFLLRGVSSFAPTAVTITPKNNQLCCQPKFEQQIGTSLHMAAEEIESTTGSRYLCLLEDYEKAMGPYFFALFDQLFEQTGHEKKQVSFLTTQKDLDELSNSIDNSNPTANDTEALDSLLESMKSSLDLDGIPEVFVLEDWNPLAIEERFSTTEEDSSQINKPTILWLYGRHNAFYTRHLLRTSGMDRWIQERCASSGNFENCVFVGEGTGALCAGATMDAAKARGDDPRGAPELQFYGLQLLGEEGGGVFFCGKEEDVSLSEGYPGIEVCKEDEVFVWAQPPSQGDEEQVATKFVMAPNRRGTIEEYATFDPLPPLVQRTSEPAEGVACYGEPPIDPSRSAQAGTIGDSEWWE